MRFSRRTLRAALAMVIGLLAACGDSTALHPDMPNSEVLDPGKYRLVHINGRMLPYVMMDDPGQRVEITSGDLNFGAGRAFSQLLVFRETTPAGTTQRPSAIVGTYTMDGSRIFFRVSSGEEFVGTRLAGDFIEYTVQGNSGALVFLFQRD